MYRKEITSCSMAGNGTYGMSSIREMEGPTESLAIMGGSAIFSS